MEKFNIEESPSTMMYVVENMDGTRFCNVCLQPVLRMPPEAAMHNPPKPYQCMECDIEIEEAETSVGAWMADGQFEKLLRNTRDTMLLDG